MNHKILISYFLVVGFFICLIFAYMKYSNNLVESENDKLRQNLASVIDKEITNLQNQIDSLNAKVGGGVNLDQIITDFLKNHPELLAQIVEDFYQEKKNLETKQMIEINAKKILDQLEEGTITTFTGNIKSPIKVIEFFDYSCSYCAKMTNIKRKILADKDVVLISLDLPILGPESLEASKVAMAISLLDQNKYFAFQEKVFETSQAKTRDNLLKIAESLKLDKNKLQNILEEKEDKIEEKLKNNGLLAQELQLQGTPTYIIDNQMLIGFVTEEKMLEAINQAKEAIKNTEKPKP
jgi:protein-disulfide isomerase